MKNKILTIFLTVILSLPISVWAVDGTLPMEENVVVTETSKQEVLSSQESLVPVNAQADEATYKQPISKRKLVKKFLTGMGAVVVSSLILFVGLTLYNRIREFCINKVKTPEGEVSLETPNDFNNAVKTFLEKTDWRI